MDGWIDEATWLGALDASEGTMRLVSVVHDPDLGTVVHLRTDDGDFYGAD